MIQLLTPLKSACKSPSGVSLLRELGAPHPTRAGLTIIGNDLAALLDFVLLATLGLRSVL
jgi:hypothetical protein